MAGMNFEDAISAKEGKAFVTLDKKIKELGEITGLEAKLTINTADVKVIGKRLLGKKAVGAEGTGTAKIHFKQSILRDIATTFIKTGAYPQIDIQVINDDPAVKGGRVVYNLKGVIFASALLNKLDVDADDVIIDETDFTFNDYVRV